MNRRSLQPSKESIQHFKRWNLLIVFYFSWFLFAHLDPYPDPQHWIRVDMLVLGYLLIYLLHPCLMHKQINLRLTVQSTGKLWKKTEWPTARTNQTPDTGDIFFPNSELFFLLRYRYVRMMIGRTRIFHRDLCIRQLGIGLDPESWPILMINSFLTGSFDPVFLGLSDPDPLVRDTDSYTSIIKQK